MTGLASVGITMGGGIPTPTAALAFSSAAFLEGRGIMLVDVRLLGDAVKRALCNGAQALW